MRRVFLLSFLVLGLGSVAVNAGDVNKSGILIDKMCAASAGSDAEKYERHKVSCALMEPCVESGYGLFADGKLYNLDPNGNTEALDFLKGLDEEKSNVKVKITGNFSGDEVQVTQIEGVD